MTSAPKIGMIDYGSGNLRSVSKALQTVGADVRRISLGPLSNDLDALVLPGVGSFGDSVHHLREQNLFESALATSFCLRRARSHPGLRGWAFWKARSSDLKPPALRFRKSGGTV